MKQLNRGKQALDLDRRLQALRQVVDIGRERFEPSLVDDARGVLERGTERMGFGKNVTVVALTGATGTGKSSLFNKLSGAELAPVGVLRPTTSAAQAAVWGEASEVLDWLGVARRHGQSDPELDGLVLLDLPDHDSTEVDHRLEVDRLVQLVDVFAWVVDPQKYADAALHDGYLRPLATHAAVTVVVLNQVDKLTEAERRQCVSDLSRLLKLDGLPHVQILSTSAVTGEGLDSLRETIEARVREERAAAERLSADLDRLSVRLAPLCGSAKGQGLSSEERERLIDALAVAGGVDVVVDALAQAHRRDAGLAMGWPFTRWLRRLRPDPLGRLHLRRRGEGGRTSLPATTPLQRAQVENAVRRVAGSEGVELPPPWPESVKSSVTTSTGDLLNQLDAAVSSTDLGENGRAAWWSFANGIQTLLATIAILGFAWLALLFALEWLQIPRPPTPEVEDIPWPTLALVGGLLAGFLLSVVFQQLARLGARRRRRRAEQRLRDAIAQVADRDVLSPIERELDTYRTFCSALAALRGQPART
jgi:GTP-binding protein EngB required for normal cell division